MDTFASLNVEYCTGLTGSLPAKLQSRYVSGEFEFSWYGSGVSDPDADSQLRIQIGAPGL
jgi:hypothetical protein